MAKVIALVQGGTPTSLEAATVQDVINHFGVKNYTGSVNKETQDPSFILEDDDMVLLVPSVKGA